MNWPVIYGIAVLSIAGMLITYCAYTMGRLHGREEFRFPKSYIDSKKEKDKAKS